VTRKDYVLISDAIRTRVIDNDPTFEERGIALAIVDALCARLHADNPRFDGARFMRACMTPSEDL
jgi:hypothetical protein